MFLLKIKSHGWYKFNGHVDTKLGDQLTSKQITGQLTGWAPDKKEKKNRKMKNYGG